MTTSVSAVFEAVVLSAVLLTRMPSDLHCY